MNNHGFFLIVIGVWTQTLHILCVFHFWSPYKLLPQSPQLGFVMISLFIRRLWYMRKINGIKIHNNLFILKKFGLPNALSLSTSVNVFSIVFIINVFPILFVIKERKCNRNTIVCLWEGCFLLHAILFSWEDFYRTCIV
jgi:hypothetical protein